MRDILFGTTLKMSETAWNWDWSEFHKENACPIMYILDVRSVLVEMIENE